MKKTRTHIPQLAKIRSILQQEINSTCPFCDNTDVEHFQIPHINENPKINELSNLILVCPTCHSKITKCDISRAIVEQIKMKLPVKQLIECANVSIDSLNCSWNNHESLEHVFYQNNMDDLSPLPIINFSFINHSKRTILLKEIQLKAKHLSKGISGLPKPVILKSIAKYNIKLPYENEITSFKLIDEIQVPSGQAFKLQVQLFEILNDESYAIQGRKVLFFSFIFNNDISISAQKIFLNCTSENDKMRIMYLS